MLEVWKSCIFFQIHFASPSLAKNSVFCSRKNTLFMKVDKYFFGWAK